MKVLEEACSKSALRENRLAELLRRAVFDAEIKRLLFNDPARAALEFNLGEEDQRKLRSTSQQEFEAAVGKFVTYKLLPTPLGGRLLISPLNGNGRVSRERDQIVLDQSLTGANIGEGGVSKNDGRVFGSGTHPSTRLCVYMLERYLIPGMRVLDLGTGSGILALAAAKLGAGEVLGLDIDPQAIPIAKTNVLRNDLGDHVRISLGDASWPRMNKVQPFHLLVSNILAEVHLESLELGMLNSILPGGPLILSGMVASGAERVAGRLQKHGCELVDQARIGRWRVLVALKGRGR